MQAARHIRQLAGDSAVYGLSGVVDRLVAVLLIPLYTRVFTQADLGVLSLLDVTVTLAATVAVLGLDSASSRWYYDSADENDRRATIASSFWCQLAAAVLLAAVLLIFAPWLSRWFTGSADHASLVRLAAITIPLTTVTRVWNGLLRYQRRPWATLVLSTVRALGRVGLIVWFVVFCRYALPGVFLGRITNLTALSIVGIVLLWPWLRLSRFDLGRLKAMLRFGLPLAPAALGIWVMASSDRFILVALCDRAEVGMYDMAAKLSTVIALGIAAFQQAWTPLAYSILHEKNVERTYARVLDVYSLVGCAMATAVVLFGPLLFRVMTTEPFYPAVSCLPALVFAHFFAGAHFLAGLASRIAKRSMPLAWSVGLGAAVNVVLNFALIPLWGRDGAALATLLSYVATTIYLFAASRGHHPIPYRWSALLGCLAMSAGLILTARLWVPPMSPVGLAVRAALLLAFVPLGYWPIGLRWSHLRPTRTKTDSPNS
ncbi:MAG: oligosaccharide flippase family protein [Pirellulaceae bacterium]|nr:oligosaccharide flippase family protein [Pirellulaceae bacterium]